MSAMSAAWDPRWRMHAAMSDGPHNHENDDPAGEHRPGRGRGRRRHGPRGGPGYGAGFGPGFGPGGFPGRPGFQGFPGPHGRRGRKRARGDIRAAVLALLAEQPMHGYQIIQEINQRSDGAWRPSPGSVYPTLQQLEDEGLVRTEQADGKRVMHLTDDGTAYVEEHRADLDRVWDSIGDDAEDDVIALRESVGQVMGATMQVMSAGTTAQREAAREILVDTRRKLYRILAED
ncbi:MAG: helix-turn-helix transcriptional regulator [Pseudonocardiales bacterium]|nr:helix-turn-helix transcriptional regulator [Pseudonocardiales bacterium]